MDGHKGISGYSLNVPSEKLTLLEIYQAVAEENRIHLLDIHHNPSDQCIVGHHIRPVLTDMFADIEDCFARTLSSKTLADCIASIRTEIDAEQNG